MNDNVNSVLTVTDLMERWSCTRHTVLALINTGKLAAFKLGARVYRVRLDEVERYEKSQAA